MTAVMANPDSEISRILSMFAVDRDTMKTGSMMLNFTDRNSENTSIELYIQRLGTSALMKNMATDGYRKNRLGRKT